MHLSFSPAADADLTDIASFIARDNVDRALTFIDELQAACTKLLDFPGPNPQLPLHFSHLPTMPIRGFI